jgi:exopolysaccharide production protein ExoZ
MILEFVFGVVVGSVFVSGRLGWPMAASAAAAIAALLLTDPLSRVIVSGLPFAALVAAAAFIGRIRTAPTRLERALARLGDASYSIYLAQVETVTLASRLIAAAVPAISPWLLLMVTGAVVVALGLLLNILLERPLLKLTRRLGGARRSQLQAAGRIGAA